MKNGGSAASAMTAMNDPSSLDDEEFDMDDLDDVQLPDVTVSATPKLKDFLPFMNKGSTGGVQGIPNVASPQPGRLECVVRIKSGECELSQCIISTTA